MVSMNPQYADVVKWVLIMPKARMRLMKLASS